MKNYLLLLFIFFATLPASAVERQMEALGRGLVAIKVPSGVYLSWRVLGSEKEASYNVYKNGVLFKSVSKTEPSNLTDTSGKLTDKYLVKAIINGEEETKQSEEVTPLAQAYKTVQLNRPPAGITPPNYVGDGKTSTSYPRGQSYTYYPREGCVGDLDGDEEYDIVILWNPTNDHDNAHHGITGNTYLDGYKFDGTFLWRIDLGINIRSGSHYTQVLVSDFDGDGRAEVVCKTAPGTIDGKGKKIVLGSDDPDADYRGRSANSNCGRILAGPEYLTVFDGETGAELHTVPYEVERGNVTDWGDNYGNRSDRFLACVAYLDGVHPSAVMCRGYYEKATLVAYDFVDGELQKRWTHISDVPGQGAYGQGNHNLSVGDVDGDGFDEIIYGSCAIDQDGTMLYRTGLGHGDALHLSAMLPDRPGELQVWQVTEGQSVEYDCALIDAKTGEILWGIPGNSDNGRGLAADIDPNHPGFEMWSASVAGTYNCKGEQISPNKPAISFRFYWDGDLQDEVLDGNKWYKWNGTNVGGFTKFGDVTTYGSKKVHVCVADLFGDWREEVIMFESADSSKIRIHTTTIPTEHRLYTLMHDPTYRNAIAWQNTGYNQPPHLGFYIGGGLENIPWPEMYTPEYTSGIAEVKQNKQAAYIRDNVLTVDFETNLKAIKVYSIDGILLKRVEPLNQRTVDIPVHRNQGEILIVEAVSETEIKTFKLFNL